MYGGLDAKNWVLGYMFDIVVKLYSRTLRTKVLVIVQTPHITCYVVREFRGRLCKDGGFGLFNLVRIIQFG